MSFSGHARRLCWHGVFLFLLGLLTGVLVGAFSNPRMGVSAHLAGVQNGMALLLFGLLWPKLSLSGGLARFATGVGIVSMYGIWLALALAAVFGTSGATPIAGAGHAGAPWQEAIVTVLLYAGSLGILAAVAVILLGFRGASSQPG
jgi:hydroxylaminobenzene mutase